MNIKKIVSLLCVSALLFTTGATVAATQTSKADGIPASSVVAGTATQTNAAKREQPTQEQREAGDAKMQEMQDKWSKLTDAQKNEIYGLMDKSMDIKSQLIDKYIEFGIIDKDTATEFKAMLTEGKSKMRENGKMPMFGGKGGRGGRGGRAEKPQTQTTT